MDVSTNAGVGPRLSGYAIAISVASIGLERINFGLRSGPTITPFLVVAPVVTWLALTQRSTSVQRPQPRTKAALGAALTALFLIISLISVMLNHAPLSLQRVALLILIACGGWSTAHLARSTNNYSAVRRGALGGLMIYSLFDLLMLGVYQRYGLSGPNYIGIVDIHVIPLGSQVSRLTGGLVDASRAALVISTYVYLLAGDPLLRRYAAKPRSGIYLAWGGALVLLTVSRSGFSVFALVCAAIILRAIRHARPTQHAAAWIVMTLFLLIFWVEPLSLKSVGATDRLAGRFTVDGSASQHLKLIEYGFGLLHANSHIYASGIGWGASYLELQSFFPGSPYANFHSDYMTTLIETGLGGLIVLLALLVPPIVGPRGWLALGLAIFGIFYQSMLDPSFWLIIAIVWSFPTALDTVSLPGRGDTRSRSAAVDDEDPVGDSRTPGRTTSAIGGSGPGSSFGSGG